MWVGCLWVTDPFSFLRSQFNDSKFERFLMTKEEKAKIKVLSEKLTVLKKSRKELRQEMSRNWDLTDAIAAEKQALINSDYKHRMRVLKKRAARYEKEIKECIASNGRLQELRIMDPDGGRFAESLPIQELLDRTKAEIDEREAAAACERMLRGEQA